MGGPRGPRGPGLAVSVRFVSTSKLRSRKAGRTRCHSPSVHSRPPSMSHSRTAMWTGVCLAGVCAWCVCLVSVHVHLMACCAVVAQLTTSESYFVALCASLCRPHLVLRHSQHDFCAEPFCFCLVRD